MNRAGTADWGDTPPLSPRHGDWCRRSTGERWGVRRVRPDGTVRWKGRTFHPRPDVVARPTPGELLLVCDYGERYNVDPAMRRDPHPIMNEWTAPPDPDGFIRRETWKECKP